jgi:hypothetical protein
MEWFSGKVEVLPVLHVPQPPFSPEIIVFNKAGELRYKCNRNVQHKTIMKAKNFLGSKTSIA